MISKNKPLWLNYSESLTKLAKLDMIFTILKGFN